MRPSTWRYGSQVQTMQRTDANDKIHFDRSRGSARRDEKQLGKKAGQNARYMSVRDQSETQHAQIYTDQIDIA
jgi:hypothetical protein